MIMTAFCRSLCLPDPDPVGCLVAGALKSALLDKGFQEIQRMIGEIAADF
jgi:hypothetical protein